jgi:DNA-binding FadR family transcriptional regulator
MKEADDSGEVPGDAGSGLLQPLANKSVVDRIIERLTRAILDRELQPGQKIPTEIELCESMQVGRNSVREAIKVLVTMGVLVIRRSEGTFVTEGFSERMLDPMVYGLILEGGDSLSMIEMRQVFETGVFLYAIRKRDDEDIKKLEESMEHMRRAVEANADEHQILDADVNFHRVLSHMLKNPLIDKVNVVIERLSRPTRIMAIRRYIDRKQLDSFLERHEDMVRVIVERDNSSVDQVLSEHFSFWRTISGRLTARK